jgi:hypothetical protein
MLEFDTALVTGASAGIGEEFARQLAPLCRRMVLVARRGERLEALAAALRGQHPHLEVTAVAADLAAPHERLWLIEGLLLRGLVPDLLVNNAGLGDYGDFATADWTRVEAMLRVNIEALTHLTHALLPGMLGSGRGAIIHVSSLASLLPLPDMAVYAATKAYVTSFSEAIRLELRDSGIRVLALCPGPVQTEFGAVAARHPGEEAMPGSRKFFYVEREQVVAEALKALARDRPRHFPGLKVAALALLLGAVPICAIRAALRLRPRPR